MLARLAAPATALLLVLTGCAESGSGSEQEAGPDPIETPKLGACRVLTPDDIAQTDNHSPTVSCAEDHTAETFAVGTFPPRVARDAEYDDPRLGSHVYQTCAESFEKFLGGDESSVMRSMLTWAWFRPSQDAWEEGARWYRCDVVAGTEESEELRALPKTAKGLLQQPADEWMMCANGETVAGSDKVPCSEPHEWRAVTTIKVGRDDDEYPGDRLVEVRSRDFCSDSVGAWMNYPVDYEFGYTYFREADWMAGNRRSICWARTDQ